MMNECTFLRALACVLLISGLGLFSVVAAMQPAHARHNGGGLHVFADDDVPPDHDDALAARANGEIKPLDDILKLLKPHPKDRLVDVALSRRDGHWIYDVTWLTKEGRYHIFSIDATSGDILKDETK